MAGAAEITFPEDIKPCYCDNRRRRMKEQDNNVNDTCREGVI